MDKQRDLDLADPSLHSVQKKVLDSLKKHWSGLTVFLAHPETPMDNNKSENTLRKPVNGRKNYYGSGSVWSAKLTAMLFSILQTVVKRYCGRDFSEQELNLIRELIAETPAHTRAELSRQVCKALSWFKPDGGLKDMSCRVAMLRMQEDGLIQLPRPLRSRPLARLEASVETDPQALIDLPVHELPMLHMRQVDVRANSRLWNEYIHRYHYLGYKALPGAQLRYWVYAGDRVVALIGFGAAAWMCAPRDQYIGWNHAQRQKNLHLVVNNARFLILPWVHSQNLASKILGLTAKQLPNDWQQRYGYRPLLLETFVEKNRFTGACYRAANWIQVGETKGRGKLGPPGKLSVPIKDVWLYPLGKYFKRGLVR